MIRFTAWEPKDWTTVNIDCYRFNLIYPIGLDGDEYPYKIVEWLKTYESEHRYWWEWDRDTLIFKFEKHEDAVIFALTWAK